MRNANEPNATVVIGDHTVTIKRAGRTRLVVAGILERIDDAEGTPRQITLDRVIHRFGEDCFEDWKVEGAVCSVLTALTTGHVRNSYPGEVGGEALAAIGRQSQRG